MTLKKHKKGKSNRRFEFEGPGDHTAVKYIVQSLCYLDTLRRRRQRSSAAVAVEAAVAAAVDASFCPEYQTGVVAVAVAVAVTALLACEQPELEHA